MTTGESKFIIRESQHSQVPLLCHFTFYVHLPTKPNALIEISQTVTQNTTLIDMKFQNLLTHSHALGSPFDVPLFITSRTPFTNQ